MFVGPTACAQNLLINGSFEQGAFVNNGQGAMSLAPGSHAITGWTTIIAETAWITLPNAFPDVSASDGRFFMDLLGYHDNLPYGGVQQTIATVRNSTYNLSFDLGGITHSNLDYSITAIAGSASQTFTYNPFLGGGDYGRFNLAFTATGSQTVITLIGASSGSGSFIGLDNVSVTGPAVPAPGALFNALMGALPGAAMVMRRRRK